MVFPSLVLSVLAITFPKNRIDKRRLYQVNVLQQKLLGNCNWELSKMDRNGMKKIEYELWNIKYRFWFKISEKFVCKIAKEGIRPNVLVGYIEGDQVQHM